MLNTNDREEEGRGAGAKTSVVNSCCHDLQHRRGERRRSPINSFSAPCSVVEVRFVIIVGMADLVLESRSADSTKSSCTTTQLLSTQDKLSTSASYTLYLSLPPVPFCFENIVHRSCFAIMKKGRTEKARRTNCQAVPCPGACTLSQARTLDDDRDPTRSPE